ncbi:MAG: virulence protein [Bacteroidales bacterium]
MFAIASDMVISDLKEHYGEPYNNSYFEVKNILRKYEFYSTQGSVYLTENDDMANLYRGIEALKKIDWFKKSVRDIRAFKVEIWSDFTAVIRED